MGPAGPAAARRSFDRFVVVVCDSVGCGDAPDAAAFGDAGANTLASVIDGGRPELPNLARLGLDRIAGVPALHRAPEPPPPPRTSWGRMIERTERSGAKDTLSGHWELMCVESEESFPVYPKGFPSHVMERFERAIGRSTLGNYRASGTEIIRELYDICAVARRQLDGPHRVARVIARPFVGADAEGFERTVRRRDLALPPPAATALDLLVDAGYRTWGVGKIHDIFAGYAAALAEFDRALPRLMDTLGPDDCLVLTADHGNDPAFRGIDHTRERVPLLVHSRHAPRYLGTRETFADLGQTVLDNFGLAAEKGTSFLREITRSSG